MFRILCLTAALLVSLPAAAADWSCSSVELPPECTAKGDPTTFDATENSCLLRLYSCGVYSEIVNRIDLITIGLAPEQNYYLGLAYFGLSNRTDAQSLKCHYFRQAKSQVEQFLIATEKNPASKVSYGGDERIDMLYQATRIYELMKKETGCVESSFSEGSLYRMAELRTQDNLKTLLHNSDGQQMAASGASTAAKKGFEAMRSNLNDIVTATSQLESRFFLYRSQIEVSKERLNALGEELQGAFGESIFSLEAGEAGLPNVTFHLPELDNRMGEARRELRTKGLNPLENHKTFLDQYFQEGTQYYDEIRQDKLAKIQNIMTALSTYTNAFKVMSPAAQSVHSALTATPGGYETAALMKAPVQDFFLKMKSKSCDGFDDENYWYCQK